jgi:hypothetical protein
MHLQLHDFELVKQISNELESIHKCFASTFPHNLLSLNEYKDTKISVSCVAYNICQIFSYIWSKSRQMIGFCISFILNIDSNNSRSSLVSTSRSWKRLRGIKKKNMYIFIWKNQKRKETRINKNLRHSRISLGEGRATTWETGSCKFIVIQQQKSLSN